MRALAFYKMNGLGNDFVVIDARREPVRLTGAQVRRIGDRRRGVGFDQLVLIERADSADARLTFFNPDGSEAGACGNGTRCAARLLLEESCGDELALATGGGLLHVRRQGAWLAVEMAVPRFGWQEIPLAAPCDTDALPIDLPGLGRPAAVSMGNPHAVFIVEDVGAVDVEGLGARLERHPLFPERANIGFAQVLSPERIRLRVFERGAGLTLACGSGACAALVTARRRGLAGDAATLILDGGELLVAWPGEGSVTMTGPASLVATGELAPELLDG
jgi:diaminopimelate epimerase